VKLVERGFTDTHFEMDPGHQTFTIRSRQDVQPILDNNKILANHTDGYSPSRDLKKVASIPMVVAEQWCNEDRAAGRPAWLTLPKAEKHAYVRRKLNDPDWQHLKTSRGPQPYQRTLKRGD